MSSSIVCARGDKKNDEKRIANYEFRVQVSIASLTNMYNEKPRSKLQGYIV